MKKKLIIGGIITLIILIAGGFATWKFINSKIIQPTFPPLPTVKVEKGKVEKVIFAKGVIAEASRKEIKPEVKAKVNQVLVKEGDTVKTGDLLFTLDEGDSKLTLEQEELSYLTKARELEKAAAAADSEVIKTTAGGRVAKLLVKEGDKVEENTLVAEVSNPDVMEVTTAFGPMDIDKVEAGQKAKVFLIDSLSYVDGKITKVDKKGRADKNGGIIHNVTARFTNPGGIVPGSAAIIEALPTGANVASLERGEIKEVEAVKVKAGAVGTVLKLEIKEGDNVKPNHILARLDIADSKLALKDRQLALRQAQLAKEIKQREMAKYRVYATQDGVITELNVVIGEEPPADKPAAVISDVQGLELKAKVEEADIPYLRVGQEATIYANAFGERRFPGVISAIAAQGKTEGSTVVFETKIRIKESGPLKVGMTGDVDITVEKKERVLRLPLSAVTIDGRKGTVMVPAPGAAPGQGSGPAPGGQAGMPPAPVPKEVTLGLEGDEFIEITGGLKEGDEVLLNPSSPQPTMGVG